MIVFKTFFGVLKSYKTPIIMNLAIVIGVITLIASTSNHSNASYYDVSQGIVVLDEDGSDVSKALISYLGTMNEVKTEHYTDDQITDMLYYTWISNYIRIPKGFGEAFLEDNEKGSVLLECKKNEEITKGYSIESEIEGYLNLLAGYMAGGSSASEAGVLATESMNDKSAVTMAAPAKVEDEKIFTVFQVLPYGIFSILLAAVLPVILRFGSEKLGKRSAVSSMPGVKRQMFITLAVIIVTMAIEAILIALASVLAGEAFTERWWLIALNYSVLSFSAVMLAVALSNFRLKPESASGISNVIGLSFCFLGGAFVPMEVLGDAAKSIGRFLPTYWHSEALIAIKNGGGLPEISKCLLIMLLFGIMVMGVGLMAGKYFEKKS
ncbi:MAG: ABC transporter permease [Lachnospiraceae bacterium]|nr:ABC transporter permease [Lachnospiraceae bacterium]